MNAIYELNVVDDVILENMTTTREFKEFSNVLNELISTIDTELYVEDVKDTTPNLRKFGADVKKNTIDTTRDIGHAYGNIVNANANLIKSSWDIVMRLINLTSRVLGFIINKISNIPKLILKVADRAMDLPGEIVAKIKGDITLYIAASDIELIYNKMIMNRLTEYITLVSGLSKGEFWSTAFRKRMSNSSNKTHLVFGENDMKLCRKMDGVYEHLKNIEFTPRIIKMNDPSIVNLYFGSGASKDNSTKASINFTDLYGKHHSCNYFEALNILIKDLESKKNDLKVVQDAVGEKLRRTEANQSYNKLDSQSKYRLNTTLNQITKVSTVIGNMVKYAMIDIDTINKSVNKILGHSNISNVSGKQAAETPSDKVNAKL